MTILLIYILIFIAAMIGYNLISGMLTKQQDFTSLKTVTFGDESSVVSNRAASIMSIIAIFLIWGSFTGSKLMPSFLHVPGAYKGAFSVPYQATDAAGKTADAKLDIIVFGEGENPTVPEVAAGDGMAKNASVKVQAYRSLLLSQSDLVPDPQVKITTINAKPIAPGGAVSLSEGEMRMTEKGSLAFEPYKGWQMEPIWLPAPETVVTRFFDIAKNGYQNVTLLDNLWSSIFRVLVGFFLGSLVGIPLGYAMGLNSWFRGWFDPIVEFMRPVPPLALIPLIIIWFGIWETGKISLLFLAALWIMVIAARSGVSGVRISKIHAAYSLGASKWQILKNVIVPNSLPDIFTGARVAMGVCWGTVVAAELVAAEKGAGKMIIAASKFQNTDIVIMGIILIGIIGYGIDILMRMAEKHLIPWKGKG
ncbi:MAG: ABC transporter permease [Anderseniella sp.]